MSIRPAHHDEMSKRGIAMSSTGFCGKLAMTVLLLGTAASLAAQTAPDPEAAPKPASDATRRYFRDATGNLAWEDREDFEIAQRGFVAGFPGDRIVKDDGRLMRDLDQRALYARSAPDTVNPSLWRNAQLLARSGLFKVSDGIYQVRGAELANMTIIVGKTGFILIDTLTTTETAKAALALARAHLGNRPVTGVIYTHSHIDHFGGAAGVIDAADARTRKIPIIAPLGFLKEAISENVIAGPAMSRRAGYAFGHQLPLGPQGAISDGIGPSFNRAGVALGTVSLVPPTIEIKQTGQTMTVDGVRMEFQLTPGTEAPAEMNVYFPDLRALSMAENANGSLHNILTLRGAQVRDAKALATELTTTLKRYGDRTDVMFASHFWPRWERPKITEYLSAHRDMYEYLHDQSVRMMNMGLNGAEIAERLTLPPALAKRWFNRGYYGTLSHNAKAVYQRYLGWYDGNPANLNPLPPEAAAQRYVDAIGGSAAVLDKGRKAISTGDYRWASELLSRLVFAEPTNRAAQLALADSLEQQGYQAESSMWRGAFLSGAYELRAGGARKAGFDSIGSTIPSLPLASILDLLSVRVMPERALATPISMDLALDSGEVERIDIRNGVMIHQPIAATDIRPESAVRISRAQFVAIVTGKPASPPVATAARTSLDRLLTLVQAPPGTFGLVTPDP
jgi:alkyl sulfatase BDS1-like metallo-beta-lactamase superfamily hydrolase